MGEEGGNLPRRVLKRRKHERDHDPPQSKTHKDYTVGWVCALEIELIAALEMLDETHANIPQPATDHNVYHLGSIAGHYVVIAGTSQAGNVIAATVVTQMRMTFPNVRFGLLVGIGGGVPVMTEEGVIRLGHVVVSKPAGLFSGAIQYDRGKAEGDRFVRTGALAPPPPVLLQAAQALGAQRARSKDDPLLVNIRRINTNIPGLRRFQFPGAERDYLFPSDYTHVQRAVSCKEGQCDLAKRTRRHEDGTENMDQRITVHRGTIASGELVLKDGVKRDKLGQEYGVLCFEMEAAGVLSDFPCLVIRGISDYCDSHKNDQWHGFAAAAAAAYARQLFFHIPIIRIDQPVVTNAPGVERIIEGSDDQGRQKIAEWISPTNYAAYQAGLFDKRQEGTGQWLLEKKEFCEWMKKKGVLYCPGIPGAGKTILSSIIINHLQKTVGHEEGVGIAYIFFNYRQQSEQRLVSILQSILRQLIQTVRVIPEDLVLLYRQGQRDGSRPQRDELLKLLVTVASNCYSRVYLVIDALDECSDVDRTRDKVISHILDLHEKCHISLLATSRFIPEIDAKFEPFPLVEIRASDADVTLFAEERVHEISNCVRKSVELSKLVVSEIVNSVGGMFLLAKLYMDSLKGKSSHSAIKTALGKLRSGENTYKNAYGGAMERIEHQLADQVTLAKRVLSWLACARRSLTLTELQHALAVEVNECSFNEENLPDIEDMISVCAGLVTYNEKSHIIALVHYTTQEYFEKEWTFWFPNAHHDIGQVCLTYVCYDVFASGGCDEADIEDRLRENPLYGYAATNWGYHAKVQSLGSLDNTLKLLEDEKKTSACAQVHAWYWTNRLSRHPWIDLPTQSTGLHLAAAIGLHHEVEALLKRNHPPNATEDSKEETPLFAAVREGHEAIVQTLLRYGANPHLQDSFGTNLLSLAASEGHESLINLLLKLGLDPNVTNRNGRSPLICAAELGHVDIVKLLLDAQADIEAKYKRYGMTALSFAAEKGHSSVVRFLLDRGALLDPTTQNEDLLPWAARHGFTSLVKVLLTEGFDINKKDLRTGCTPLSNAVMHGHGEVAALLVEKGANVASRDNFGRTPFFHSLERSGILRRVAEYFVPDPKANFEHLSQLLLKKDPQLLNCRDDFGRSPILLAAENRFDKFLQMIDNRQEHTKIISMETELVLGTIRASGYDLQQDKGEFLLL